MIGAIEAGGTKCVCAVFSMTGKIIDRVSIPTEIPSVTVPKIINYFKEYPEIKSIGIGSFGPIGVNKAMPDYGYITSTPKIKWQDYNFKGSIEKAFPNIRVAWTTDVNAAAYGELKRGAGVDVESCIYITVGTGIGAGIIIDGKIMDGYSHPEAGHMTINRHIDDFFTGVCPYHGACLEGMASGPAIEKRWKDKGTNLSENNKVWMIEAYYLAQAIYNFSLITSPEKIIIGGGVMKQKQLYPLIKVELEKINKKYIKLPNLDDYIVPPELRDNAGIIGCYELAKATLQI